MVPTNLQAVTVADMLESCAGVELLCANALNGRFGIAGIAVGRVGGACCQSSRAIRDAATVN